MQALWRGQQGVASDPNRHVRSRAPVIMAHGMLLKHWRLAKTSCEDELPEMLLGIHKRLVSVALALVDST